MQGDKFIGKNTLFAALGTHTLYKSAGTFTDEKHKVKALAPWLDHTE